MSMSQISRNSGLDLASIGGGSLARGASVTFSDQNYPQGVGGVSQGGGRGAPLNRANSISKGGGFVGVD